MELDLNCDLGEGEPPSRTRALLRHVTSANIACGGHAGSLATMAFCVRWANRQRVKVGAHPGAWSRDDFGRGDFDLSPDEFELLLLHQVGALERIARGEGARLHHLKLHGTLYHASERDARLRRRYLDCVARWWPRWVIYAQAGGTVARQARRTGLRVWEEVFLDRGYCADGSLVPRGEPSALLTRPHEVLHRLRRLQREGVVETTQGCLLGLRAQTVCLHSDTPPAARLARLVRNELRD